MGLLRAFSTRLARRHAPDSRARTADPIALAGLALAVVFGVASIAAGSSGGLAGLWLVPVDLAICASAARLGRGADARRSRGAWLGIAAAGAILALADLASSLYPGAAALTVAGLACATLATALFSAERRARRSVALLVLDLVLVVAAAAGSALWAVLPDGAGAMTVTDLAARLPWAVGAVVAVSIAARVALLPTTGASGAVVTLLVSGIVLGVFGALAVCVPWPVAHGAGAAGALLLGLGRAGLLLAARLEALSRADPTLAPRVEVAAGASRNEARFRGSGAQGPVLMLCLAIGLWPLAATGFEVGPRHVPVVAVALLLCVSLTVRQALAMHLIAELGRAWRMSDARFGWLVRNSSDLIFALDTSGRIEYVSPSVERLLRAPDGALLGRPLGGLAHPEDVERLSAMVSGALSSPDHRASGEWRLRLADGAWLPVETIATSGAEDGARGVVLNTRDLQERKSLEQKLTFQAFHDPLTRLANRSLFRERIEHALERRHGADVVVLVLDLDNFKTVNDSLGHGPGDQVLVETAHRLRSCLRTEDTAARLGGDEFAVLLEDADVTSAARVAERIRHAFAAPYLLLGQEVFTSASIGIAVREPGDTAGDLLRNADVAMYTAKTKGKGRFEVFEAAMHDAVVARLAMEAELRRAIERDEFLVLYQPIVRLESGEVIGAEALVRWQHPQRGLVAPLEFIPLAEETGLIVPLGGWVLRQACRQLAEWQRLRIGGEPFTMSVNMSSRQLVREEIVDEVAAAIDESGIRANWLTLEVTETVLMADPAAASQTLGRLRELGVRIALDDFGTGFSSLSHLRRFPIDIVKIDKSFVDDVAGEGGECAIARGIIDLGRAMQLQTVAEGIEADDQAETLLRLGCELGQGYYFARPLAPPAWADLLRTDEAA